MSLIFKMLEDTVQTQSNQEALAIIGKVIAGLAMKAHYSNISNFLQEFKNTDVFQSLLKNNFKATNGQDSIETVMKSDEFKKAMQQIDTDGQLFKNKDFNLAEVLKACFATKKGSNSYINVHNAFKQVFGFDYADVK